MYFLFVTITFKTIIWLYILIEYENKLQLLNGFSFTSQTLQYTQAGFSVSAGIALIT